MSAMRKPAVLAAILAGLALVSGCGNAPDRGAVGKSILAGLKKKPVTLTTPEQVNAMVATSLGRTDLPLALAHLEARKATVILTQIESNGAYHTWSASDRRTIITNGGIVTGTRGLGGDVMSSGITEIAPLIHARKAGSGRHVIRSLDGENHTVETVANCQITRGGTAKVSGGSFNNVATTEMIESCSLANGASFTNHYYVDGLGQVLKSRQWLGEINGRISLQLLR